MGLYLLLADRTEELMQKRGGAAANMADERRLADDGDPVEHAPTNVPALLLRALVPDGFVWLHGWKVFGGFLYSISVVCCTFFLSEEIKDLRSLGALYYFNSFWNFADVGLLTTLFFVASFLFVPGLSDLELIYPLASLSMLFMIGRLLQARRTPDWHA